MNKKHIQTALRDFKFHASPSNGNHSDPATIRDIHNLINQTEKLIKKIVESLDD